MEKERNLLPVHRPRFAVPFLAAGLGALVGCFGLTGARPAYAQGGGIVPVRFKLGVVNLKDGDARDLAGSPLYTGEVDLALPSTGKARTTFTIGYQERRAHGGLLRVVPITVAHIYSLNNPASTLTGSLYYGLGVGTYITRATKDGSSQSKTSPGGFAVAGYQLPGAYFVEAKYQLISSKVKGASASGVLFMVGRHF